MLPLFVRRVRMNFPDVGLRVRSEQQIRPSMSARKSGYPLEFDEIATGPLPGQTQVVQDAKPRSRQVVCRPGKRHRTKAIELPATLWRTAA
jgi:hypothetical protein